MISLVVPSRGRPGRFKEMVDSAYDTADGPLQVIARLDDDDETRHDYFNAGRQVIARRGVLSEAWNDAARLADGELIMMAADDLIFRTTGWDSIVYEAVEEYRDRICMVHVNDGFQNERIATHPIITRRWYEVIGMLCPPFFTADYNDVWLHEVAEEINRKIYLPRVFVEHMHPDAGKAEFDTVYAEQRARRDNDRVGDVYASLAGVRHDWVEKLLEAKWALKPSTSSNA